jgi:hypothetical protein
MNLSKNIFGILAASAILFTACDSDDDNTNTPAPDLKGAVEIEFEHVWGPAQTPFQLGTAFTHPASQEVITFTTLKYYISNIVLHKSNGDDYIVPESYHLVDASSDHVHIDLSDVPAGSYTGMTYLIGVDSTRNVSGAQTGALDPANNMFWSWNSGYIFVKAEGTSPASASGNFTYHIGGFTGPDQAIRERHHDFQGATLNISPSATPTVHILANAARFWHGGLSLSTLSNVHMPGANASTLATNFADGVVFDHIHN